MLLEYKLRGKLMSKSHATWAMASRVFGNKFRLTDE